ALALPGEAADCPESSGGGEGKRYASTPRQIAARKIFMSLARRSSFEPTRETLISPQGGTGNSRGVRRIRLGLAGSEQRLVNSGATALCPAAHQSLLAIRYSLIPDRAAIVALDGHHGRTRRHAGGEIGPAGLDLVEAVGILARMLDGDEQRPAVRREA